jgi:plastocyanin
MKLIGALVLVLALAAVPAAIGARATTEPEIEMEDFSYRPARKVVARGALVVWKNRDRAPHNASSLARLRTARGSSAPGRSASAAR